MGKITGFLELERVDRDYAPVDERLKNYNEFVIPLGDKGTRDQAARCMDCGVPYCHNGCPVNNQIPDWNDLVYRGDWLKALKNLHSTNNFPEFTGRICPAPCEAACTLNIQRRAGEHQDHRMRHRRQGLGEGWITPEINPNKTGKKVAVIGSGPSGLACAQQLARAGHDVHLYEKNAKAGGLMRYGIPDFKMEKRHLDRRVDADGSRRRHVPLRRPCRPRCDDRRSVAQYDAVALAGGAEKPRDLPIPGRELDGIHFAMDFLPQQNRRVSDEPLNNVKPILAGGKHVVVIGGGDTGSDCIGTSNRQGALSVTQIEIMPAPPEKENKALTWPLWPMKMRTSSSQEEGVTRDFAVATVRFEGENGVVKKLVCARADEKFQPIPGTEFELKADLVLLAMGFLGPVQDGMIKDLGVELDKRGNVLADTLKYKTSKAKVFSCGDMRRGQSLVVWAIREGRQCARAIDQSLMGETTLPR